MTHDDKKLTEQKLPEINCGENEITEEKTIEITEKGEC